MAESGGASSVDGRDGAGNKRLKLDDNGDRLSALPDSIIHHILSFLPSTKETIRTGTLSKRWQYQWTRVPVLIFDFWNESLDAYGEKDFSPFVESSLVLYDCSKLSVFQLHVMCESCQYNRAIRFAVVRNVEELVLNFSGPGFDYKLPKFFFNNPSLVRLETWNCLFVSDLNVNFKSLKVLQIHMSEFGDGVIEKVICGSPVLESLDLRDFSGFKQLVITSKSLKSLSLRAHFVSVSLIEIECPKLEKLVLGSLPVLTFRLKSPSLIFGTLHHSPEWWDNFSEYSAKQIVKQFPHVLNLRLSGEYAKTALQAGGLRAPLNCKSLTLECVSFDMQLPEIEYALCNSPQLEKLVIDLRLSETVDRTGLTDFEETFGHSNGSGYACLASHLKTAKIIGLSKENHKIEVGLQFVEFLLKNGRALEKMVVILRDGGFKFLAQVSQKLLKVPRCSTHCTVEVLSTCSEVKYCLL